MKNQIFYLCLSLMMAFNLQSQILSGGSGDGGGIVPPLGASPYLIQYNYFQNLGKYINLMEIDSKIANAAQTNLRKNLPKSQNEIWTFIDVVQYVMVEYATNLVVDPNMAEGCNIDEQKVKSNILDQVIIDNFNSLMKDESLIPFIMDFYKLTEKEALDLAQNMKFIITEYEK